MTERLTAEDLPPLKTALSDDAVLEDGAGRQARLTALRRHITEIEGRTVTFDDGSRYGTHGTCHTKEASQAWDFGLPAIDRNLPDGSLATGAMHDIIARDYPDGPASIGFCLSLLRRLRDSRAISGAHIFLWCQSAASARNFGFPYGLGMTGFGLDPDLFIFATVPRDQDVLWVLEESLRAQALLCVIGEVAGFVDFTATRRLSLLAMEQQTPCLLLRQAGNSSASAAWAQWRIASNLSGEDLLSGEGSGHIRAPGAMRWCLELIRCRGGRPGTWDVEWNSATGGFNMVAALADRKTGIPRPAAEPVFFQKRTG